MTTADFIRSVNAEIRRMVALGEQDALRDYPVVSPFSLDSILPQFKRNPRFLCVCETCGGTGDQCPTCRYGRGYLTRDEAGKVAE